MSYEYVKHPSHYSQQGRKDCWDEWVDKYGADYAAIICLGTVDKYLYRFGTKPNNEVTMDVKKAREFFNKASTLIDMCVYVSPRVLAMQRHLDKALHNAEETLNAKH